MDAVRGKPVALTICFSERDMLILHFNYQNLRPVGRMQNTLKNDCKQRTFCHK